MPKITPCDSGECPFDARYGEDCRVHCGLGVDESGPPEEKYICIEHNEHHYIRTINRGYVCMHCGAAMPDPPEDSPPPYDKP